MDIEKLKQILNYECKIVDILAFYSPNNKIKKYTIRKKGQYNIQRFYYIINGNAKFVLNNNLVIHAKPGDILYLPPDVTYKSCWTDTENNSATSIYFNLYQNEKEVLLFDNLTLVLNDKFKVYYKLFNSLLQTYNDSKLGYKLKCQSILLEIITLISSEVINKTLNQRSDVTAGIIYIENNYLEQINVDSLAKMCNMSSSSFRQKFHNATGMSPIKYKNYIIMRKASELIKSGEFTIGEVADKLNFDDIYYFNRLFKSFYGVPPGKFKNKT